jgi:hypothetical protein
MKLAIQNGFIGRVTVPSEERVLITIPSSDAPISVM